MQLLMTVSQVTLLLDLLALVKIADLTANSHGNLLVLTTRRLPSKNSLCWGDDHR